MFNLILKNVRKFYKMLKIGNRYRHFLEFMNKIEIFMYNFYCKQKDNNYICFEKNQKIKGL